MTEEQKALLQRLRDLPPMPDDKIVTQIQLDDHRMLIDLISISNPTTEFIGPLLDSCGYGDGFGIYYEVSNILYKMDRKTVLKEIKTRLLNSKPGAKLWSLYCLAAIHQSGKEPVCEGEYVLLEKCLSEDILIRKEVVRCLGVIKTSESRALLKKLKNDPNKEVSDRAKSWLE